MLAEFLGAAFLAALVIGSGIAAQQLSPGNTGLELLENAAATAAGLFTIILMFGPVSGGHFNPVVSLADASFGGIRWRDALAYAPAQIGGCVLGAIAANGMFGKAAISISTKHRASPAHLLAEVIATAGLLLVIFSLARTRRAASAPAAVGAYIGAAYFFTSSTSFANPAIAIGRIFSNTCAGIAPAAVPGFVLAELAGGAAAVLAIRALYPDVTPAEAATVVVPHGESELPMAPGECGLDGHQLAEQRERYTQLGAAVREIQRDGLRATVTFGEGLDRRLLEETLSLERECCSFLAIEYAPAERRLSIGAGAPDHAEVLEAIVSALASGAPPSRLA